MILGMASNPRTLSGEIGRLLRERNKTVSTAESCTAGAIASAIVSTPGASGYFNGGVVSYTNGAKQRLLGVDPGVLEEKTAVCEEVAIAMVRGAIRALGTDYAISATGVAGPTGGTPGIPVGTIWLAAGDARDIVTLRLDTDNGREENLRNAVARALGLFHGYLVERKE